MSKLEEVIIHTVTKFISQMIMIWNNIRIKPASQEAAKQQKWSPDHQFINNDFLIITDGYK